MEYDKLKKSLVRLGFIEKEINFYEININGYIISIDISNEENQIISSNINYGNKIIVEHGGITNFTKKESLVQLECVIRLLKKGYNPEEIELEKTYRLGHKDKGRLDVLVKKDNVAWCLIECKVYGDVYFDEIKKVESDGSQIFSYYAQDRTPILIGVYTSDIYNDNNNIMFYQISTNKLDKVGSVKDIYKSWDKSYVEIGIFNENAEPYEFEDFNLRKSDLKELNKTIGNKLYNNFMEILRRHAISDKSNAFNIFFNLFVCKIYDEEFKGENDVLDFQWKLSDTIDDFINRISKLYYSSLQQYLSLECDEQFYSKFGNETVFPIREFSFIEILNKNDYIKNTNILIEVVKILQEYKIKYFSRQQFLGDFFENLLNKGFKQESGQFFTPIPLTRFILRSLPIDRIIKNKIERKEPYILPYIIDYACGSGHFLTEAMLEIEKNFKFVNEGDLTGPQARNFLSTKNNYYWAKEYIYGIEKDSRLAKTAKIAMFLNGDGDADIVSHDGLADFYKNNVYKNKLKSLSEARAVSSFDIVVSNPPFSIEGFFNTVDNIENFSAKDYLTEKSCEIECFFLERTLQLLKGDGYTGLIFPLSILNNKNALYTYIRQLIIMNFEVFNITEMREKVFSATNTSVAIFFMRKRTNDELMEIIDGYAKLKNISPNESKIIDIKKFVEENKYIDFNLNNELCAYIINDIENNKKILVAFSGEKKTQEYFQGYRTEKSRGREELVEKNYGILTSIDDQYGDSDLASVIHAEFLEKHIDFSDKELSKFAMRVLYSDLFDVTSDKYLISTPSKFLTKKTIKVESLSPKGDFIDNYDSKETSLEKLKEEGDIDLISGLIYEKQDEVPFKTDKTVLTASNIDIKTGRLTYENKLVYLREDYKTENEKQIRKNDIVMSMSSGSLKHLGKVALIENDDFKDMVGGFLAIIRCKDEYIANALYYRLMSKKFREYVFSKKGQNINNLNISELLTLPLDLPTDIKKFYKEAVGDEK